MSVETIFALSSGAPPAGIAVIRVSGPQAAVALRALSGAVPEPRRARLASLRDSAGELLDRALVLWFPGPATATGEDLAEFHLHGGRAVVAAVEAALAALPGLRRAQAGEFTRRAFANERMDLAEAEGLADLLSAETELQRRAAMSMAGGTLSRQVEGWRERLLMLSAKVEADLDFGDEDDVIQAPLDMRPDLETLAGELEAALDAPSAVLLKEGFRVALAGPPNAGKSTLFNALVDSEAAITSPIAGTTRDILTRSVAIEGVPLTFVDMAGLRGETTDAIEALGIERAGAEMERADLVLWLGLQEQCPDGAWDIAAQCDREDTSLKVSPRLTVSAVTGEGLAALRRAIVDEARTRMPKPGEVAITQRQRALLEDAASELRSAIGGAVDPLIVAEQLRLVRLAFDRLVGRSSTEDVLDALFGRFCIGK